MSDKLQSALDAALDKTTELAGNATANDMAYLGNFLKNTGPGSVLNEVMLAGSTQIDAIRQASAAQKQAIQQAGDDFIEQLQGGDINIGALQDGARPMLYGVFDRFSMAGSFLWGATTQFGKMHETGGKMPFQLMMGMYGDATLEKWKLPPQLQFMLGDSWHHTDVLSEMYRSGNQAQYPNFAVAVMFVKNTTASNITRNLGHIHSAYWASGYEGASLNVGTPAKTHDQRKQNDGVNWSAIHSKTASTSGEQVDSSIVIPANKTIAIVKYASAQYAQGYGSIYNWILRCGFTGLNQFLGNGLEIDLDITTRAQQVTCQNDYEVWRA